MAKNFKEFYTEYKAQTTPYKMCNKTFIKLFGNQFAKYAQQNDYKWEQIVHLFESFGFKYLNKHVA